MLDYMHTGTLLTSTEITRIETFRHSDRDILISLPYVIHVKDKDYLYCKAGTSLGTVWGQKKWLTNRVSH